MNETTLSTQTDIHISYIKLSATHVFYRKVVRYRNLYRNVVGNIRFFVEKCSVTQIFYMKVVGYTIF